jgi:hypothetical protein
MEKFNQAKGRTNDPALVADAEKGYQDALLGLSQDSTGDGLTILNEALAQACDAKLVTSPAVGLAKDEAGRALVCKSAFTLPTDLRALKPGHFMYVITREEGQSEIQRCPYTNNHTLVRVRYWWKITVTNVLTGKVFARQTFYGTSPATCPYQRFFFSFIDYEYGGKPVVADVIAWLKGTLR